LINLLKGVPKSHIYRIIRGGEVRVNKKRAKPGQRLVEGDNIRIPPIKLQPRVDAEPSLSSRQESQLTDNILHEDAKFILLNKPSGMAVHGGSGLSFGVIEAMRALKGEQQSLELVHRLDKETSGCLLIAKKHSFLRAMHVLLREKRITKVYWALLDGAWQGNKHQVVDVPLQRSVMCSGERMVQVSSEGKQAKTHFKLLENYRDCCLVEARPVTGRTHQIRVHAKHLGHAIIGDKKYGDPDVNKNMRQRGCKRLFLHAHSLRFRLPDQAEQYFTAELEPTLQTFLTQLEGI